MFKFFHWPQFGLRAWTIPRESCELISTLTCQLNAEWFCMRKTNRIRSISSSTSSGCLCITPADSDVPCKINKSVV